MEMFAKNNLYTHNKAQALLLQRQSPDKGMPHKTLPKRVTQFRFSHCTLGIVRIPVTPMHLVPAHTRGKVGRHNLQLKVMGRHKHVYHSKDMHEKFRMAGGPVRSAV